ncbi:hypothetical protein QYE76_029187 [Lolium multiflorum]|uniref:Reverse transcriptase Ty1/copia-type domain-containing protein n=1 Tax=Lolium multiflorum TaxID=4521 RepID=A0AAD8QP32_LOLMU|nr:hypothetical protein QYE76_029187 [Lolium multiflorum]
MKVSLFWRKFRRQQPEVPPCCFPQKAFSFILYSGFLLRPEVPEKMAEVPVSGTSAQLPDKFRKSAIVARLFPASNELWRIIQEGFKPYNPDKLTRREAVDSQLNNTALHMIQTSVGTKDLPRVRNYTTAKEAWDGLAASCIGSESTRRNKYNALKNKAEGFMRLPDEDHQDMYSRLLIVADDFRLIGATHINDSWIKEKYIECMMPYVPIDVKTLVGRECYSSLSSQDAVHEMQALKVLEQNSHDSLNRAIGMSKGNNLALVVNPLDEVHPQEQYRASWKLHNGRLIPKDKSKESKGKYSKAPNKKFYNNKTKKGKRHPKVMLVTREEYSSDEVASSSDDEEGSSKEMAAIVTTNIPSSSLFESPNENPHIKNAHCFMATSSLDTSIVLSTQEEYSSGDDEGDDEEDATSNGLVALASLSTNSSSPSESPNEIIHVEEESCLMAKSSEDYAAGGSKWVLDSGCTSHMTGGKNLVKELRPNINNITVSFGDNSTSEKVFEALEDSDWVDAMHEELNNFKRNKVWTLVEKPKECRNVIGTKWIFKNKQDEFGNILMTDRFEMSMMGEMKFFLGFEIKQLREGTFINQAKYLQDMLKRFKMTELKGVATPMVTKCHLALDPNGSSKKRNKGHVDEIEEELEQTRPSKLTSRQQASQRSKTPAARGKNIHVSVKNMQYPEYKEIRDMNPYLTPRSNRVSDKRFHNKTQEEIFYEVYVPFKKGVTPQHAIDTGKMAASKYFAEAYAMCGEFGLYPIMELTKEYDVEMIHQFYATVHFDTDEAKTFRWMSHEKLLESNLAKFGAALGYPRLPGVDANGWRCHDSSFSQPREVLEPLYIKGWGIPGKSADLLPTWDIMLRVYRETIGPKGGNLDELHLYEVDLMANSFAKRGTGEKIDVMDYIYNEMWSCVMEKKLPAYAPYIMKLIEDTWVDTCQTSLIHSIPLNVTMHDVKVLRTKRHNTPIEDVPPKDEKPPSWASKLARHMRQIFCLTAAVNHRQYQQHAEAKKSRVRQKSIMRALAVEVSPPGSEENITPEAEWISQHGLPLPPDGLEIESPPHTPPYPGAPSDLPPGWANADPWDV